MISVAAANSSGDSMPMLCGCAKKPAWGLLRFGIPPNKILRFKLGMDRYELSDAQWAKMQRPRHGYAPTKAFARGTGHNWGRTGACLFGQLLIESEDLARPWRWLQGRDFLFERLQPPKIRRVGLVADLGGKGPYIRNSYPGLSWSSWPT